MKILFNPQCDDCNNALCEVCDSEVVLDSYIDYAIEQQPELVRLLPNPTTGDDARIEDTESS